MLWVALALFLFVPAWADEISAATREHLQSLEEAAARLEREGNKSKYYEKLVAEIDRIKKEYRLVSPVKAKSQTTAPSAQPKYSENKESWEKKTADFRATVEEELKSRQRFSRFYQTEQEWLAAYKLQMQFAQAPVASGGLGFEYTFADRWSRSSLKDEAPEVLAAVRKRYKKAVAYALLPRAQGGLGYSQEKALNTAFKQALSFSDAQLDVWIKASRADVLKNPGIFTRIKKSCRSWFEAISR